MPCKKFKMPLFGAATARMRFVDLICDASSGIVVSSGLTMM